MSNGAQINWTGGYNQPNMLVANGDTNWTFGFASDNSTYYFPQVKFYSDGTDNRGFRVWNSNGGTTVFLANQLGAKINGNTVLHAGNYTSYRGTQLISPNGATIVAADSAMPDYGHSFIHTLGYGPSSNDGHILGMSWAGTTSSYGAQLWLDTDPTNRMAFRSRSSSGVWTGWNEVIH